MEYQQPSQPKKSNRGVTAIIVILFVLILAAVGYAIYYYYEKKTKAAEDIAINFITAGSADQIRQVYMSNVVVDNDDKGDAATLLVGGPPKGAYIISQGPAPMRTSIVYNTVKDTKKAYKKLLTKLNKNDKIMSLVTYSPNTGTITLVKSQKINL